MNFFREIKVAKNQTLKNFLTNFISKIFFLFFKVLVLGAGYVSAPVVDYLTRDESIGVTVCSHLKEEAKKVAQR